VAGADGADRAVQTAGADGAAGQAVDAGREPLARRQPSLAARRARRRGLIRLAVLVLVLVSLAVLSYLLLASSTFGVRSVVVTGTGVLTDDQVREAAAVPAGQPLLRLDSAAAAERVAALAAVAQVRVERSWPSTVILHVTERVPVAFEPTDAGARLVDGGGLFFATVPTPPPGLPELHAVEGAPARAAATVIAALGDPAHQALRAEVSAVSADSPADVRLRLRGDRTVRWGSSADSDRKATVLAVLLSQHGQIYDVASPDLPTIR
jgi:cell division protein FtsQ